MLGQAVESINMGLPVIRGKVRDIIDLGSRLLIVTTDRISAFDRVLSTIPCKGEVLNRISLFWFGKTADIIPNHVERAVSARSVLVRKCELVPVEVVVRGYLTGSAWRDYRKGKDISGIRLPEGMRFNERFEEPLVTPSTKAERGVHDEPISEERLVSEGIVAEELWKKIRDTALSLYRRGSEVAAERGMILVDTKYEFGLYDGELILVDEIHTPDSSRYWYRDTYQELFERGEPQRKLDKEYLRQWLIGKGFMGDGEIPEIPDEVRVEVAWRYIKAYETVTGEAFRPESGGVEEEVSLLQNVVNGFSM